MIGSLLGVGQAIQFFIQELSVVLEPRERVTVGHVSKGAAPMFTVRSYYPA
jgi:hypothetical protein